ncbi:MAG: hypothetical protein M3Q49_01655 [Actinomycetota bacterium]|nr:hypothetical protein [Actinomycetota bacterium]
MHKIYMIVYRGRKKGNALQATKLNFGIEDIRNAEGLQRFTYQDGDNIEREVWIRTDDVLEIAEFPGEPPGAQVL